VRLRLFSVLLLLMACVLLALGLPLARSLADREHQSLFLDRLADTARFASLAGQGAGGEVGAGGDLGTLGDDLRRYDETYGVGAAVVARDGRMLVSSRPGFSPAEADREGQVAAARSGRRSEAPTFRWPWDPRPLVVAEPVYRAGDVVAVAVTVSPTDRMRATVLRGWATIAAGSVVVLLLLAAAAGRLAGWALRPVRTLDAAAHAIATGQLSARVRDNAGPPELRRLARSFNEMADTVAGALEQQRAFVANASHQLRNPLGALLLRLEAAGAGARPDPELESAREEAARLARVLDDLLALARLESSRGEPRRLDPVAVVAERIRSWRLVADRRNIDVVLVLDDAGRGGRRVLVDPTAFGSSLDALLDNALKFSPEGSTVRVSVAPVGGQVEVRVADEGPGLDLDDYEHIGDRFWRSPRHQNVAGSGLGLSIVKTLLEPYGGRLAVTPGDPCGLVVAVRLPAAPPASTVSA